VKRIHCWPEGHWGWLIPVTHKHGIRCGDLAFVGGQVDKDIKGLVLHAYDLATQTREVMTHIHTVLRGLGLDPDDLVKLVAFYVNRGEVDESAFLADVASYLPGPVGPAITAVPVPYLAYPGMLVEIEAVAMRREDGVRLAPAVAAPAGRSTLLAPFSPGLRRGRMLHVSGQTARDGAGRVVHAGDFDSQGKLVMENVDRILTAAGAGFADVVKMNTYYRGADSRDWFRCLEAWAPLFPVPGPVVSGIPLPWLPDGLAITMDLVAMLGEDGGHLSRHAVAGDGDWAPAVPQPYTAGLRCGEMVFVGAQVAKDRHGVLLDPGGLVPQTHTVMRHIRSLLGGFGLAMDDVVKVNTFFQSGGTAEELNANLRVRSACFTEPGPATTGITLPALAETGLMIQVEVTAMAP